MQRLEYREHDLSSRQVYTANRLTEELDGDSYNYDRYYGGKQIVPPYIPVPSDQSPCPVPSQPAPIIIVEQEHHRDSGRGLRTAGAFLLSALSAVNIGVYGRNGGFQFGGGYPYGNWRAGWNSGYPGFDGNYYYNPGRYYNPACPGNYHTPGYYDPYAGYDPYHNPYGSHPNSYAPYQQNNCYRGYGRPLLNMMINTIGRHHGGWGNHFNYRNYLHHNNFRYNGHHRRYGC